MISLLRQGIPCLERILFQQNTEKVRFLRVETHFIYIGSDGRTDKEREQRRILLLCYKILT